MFLVIENVMAFSYSFVLVISVLVVSVCALLAYFTEKSLQHFLVVNYIWPAKGLNFRSGACTQEFASQTQIERRPILHSTM